MEEAVNLTTFAKQAAADSDPIVAKAGATLQADLLALTKALKKVSGQLDDQTKEYDVLYPDETAKAIIILGRLLIVGGQRCRLMNFHEL